MFMIPRFLLVDNILFYLIITILIYFMITIYFLVKYIIFILLLYCINIQFLSKFHRIVLVFIAYVELWLLKKIYVFMNDKSQTVKIKMPVLLNVTENKQIELL